MAGPTTTEDATANGGSVKFCQSVNGAEAAAAAVRSANDINISGGGKFTQMVEEMAAIVGSDPYESGVDKTEAENRDDGNNGGNDSGSDTDSNVVPTIGRSPSMPDEGGLTEEEVQALEALDATSRHAHMILEAAPTDVTDKYDIEATNIGCGNYGVIRQCRNRETGERFALKSIPKNKAECKAWGVKNFSKLESIKREAEILKTVSHPSIICLVDTYEDAKFLHLVTEKCSGGMMFDRIIAKDKKPYTEHQAATLVKSILEAVAYLHDEMGIVHRDIKLENFLLVNNTDNCLDLKLIDFGMSRTDPLTTPMHTSIGTAYYIAPEVLAKSYGKSCDLWSVGVVTYMIICGYYPFYGDNTTQIIRHVSSGKFDYPAAEWRNVSSAAKDFISSLLTVDVEARLTAAQAMEHPWIVKQTAPKKSLGKSLSKSFKKHMSSLGKRGKTV